MSDAIIYNLPEVWASAIVNDDYSGFTDNEVNIIANFLSDLEPWQYLVLADQNEPEFMHNHDATEYGWLADNCYQFQLMQ